METRSIQEVFDIVSKHLLTQNKKSMVGVDCRYRAEVNGTNLMCAVGCLIPDDFYQPSMEGTSVGHLIDWNRGLWPYLGVDANFTLKSETARCILSDMQKIHDSFNVIRWKKELTLLAKNYQLTIKPEIFGEEGSEEENIGS